MGRWSGIFGISLFRRDTVFPLLPLILLLLTGLFLPFLAVMDPLDPASLSLMNSFEPPLWLAEREGGFWLGSDDQGRDLLSAIFYGVRISLLIALGAVLLSAGIGIPAGLLAGYRRGPVDRIISGLADIQASFPAILVALVIDGILRQLPGRPLTVSEHGAVLVVAIGLGGWVQYARLVRNATKAEAEKDYVLSARVAGLPSGLVLGRHILPNIAGPVLVVASLHLATAVLVEATLSFLGVGMPATMPSLGSLVRNGQNYLFSGEWWIVLFPGLALALLVFGINVSVSSLRSRTGFKTREGEW